MKMTFAVDTAALEKALAALPSQMRKSSLQAAARAGMKQVAARAKALAPEDTGEMKRGIAVGTGKGGGSGRVRAVVYIKGPAYRRAHLAEFGTARAAAQPFLRPALEQAHGAAVKAAAETLEKHLAKNAAKLAGPDGVKHFRRGLKADAKKKAFQQRRAQIQARFK